MQIYCKTNDEKAYSASFQITWPEAPAKHTEQVNRLSPIIGELFTKHLKELLSNSLLNRHLYRRFAQ